jgi:hypothetical protein
LEEDEDVLPPERNWDSESGDPCEDEVLLFDEKEDYELVRAVEEGLITSVRSHIRERLCLCSLCPFSSGPQVRRRTRSEMPRVASRDSKKTAGTTGHRLDLRERSSSASPLRVVCFRGYLL